MFLNKIWLLMNQIIPKLPYTRANSVIRFIKIGMGYGIISKNVNNQSHRHRYYRNRL
jgi:hypothetical protein